MAHCEECGRHFDPETDRQRFCKTPACIADRRSKASIRYRDRNKAQRASSSLNLCLKGCGRKTSNRFGICDFCRGRILQGMDTQFLGV